MKLRGNQKEFLEAIGAIQSITDRKSTMPILANIRMQAKGDRAYLTATDLEVGTLVSFPAQVFEEGELAIPSRQIYDIVRELTPSIPIELEALANNWLYIKSGNSQFRIACLDAREFPALPERERQVAFSSSGSTWVSVIGKVAFAMSKDETRYHLNGVYVDGRPDGFFRLVATDGHRLATIEQECPFPETYSAILPRKGVTELAKFAERAGEAPIEAYLGRKNLDIVSHGERLVIRLIEGDFPKYEQVIPKDTAEDPFKVIDVRRESLVSALRRVCILANERSFGIRVSFSTGNLELSTQGSDRGEGKEEMECTYRGEFFQIGFNARYFLDILNVMKSEIVTLKLRGPLHPCLIQSNDPSEAGWQAVLMPMRI